MAAIITDDFRKDNAQILVDNINASPAIYFIGLGKSDQWEDDESLASYSADPSGGSVVEKQDALDNLSSLKLATGATRLIPKNTWYSGRKYKIYNPNDVNCFEYSGGEYPCYVYNETNNSIYICLSKQFNSSISSVKPSSASYTPFSGADTYVWALCYINEDTLNSFYNANSFIPIIDDPVHPVSDASSGMIFGFDIITAGSGGGATTDLTGTIVCDVEYDSASSPNTAQVSIDVSVRTTSGGGYSRILVEVDQIGDSYSPDIGNQNIIRATVVSVSGGISAITGYDLIPLISPIGGFNASPLTVLPSYYSGISADFSSDDMVLDVSDSISYRQVTLIKDPTLTDNGDSPLTTDSADALKYLTASAVTGGLTVGNHDSDIIEFDSGAKAFLDYIEQRGATYYLYYHQNSSRDINRLIPTPNDDVALLNDVAATTTDASHLESEYQHGTGTVIFIENRKPITRTSNQVDDVRLIIQM